ncbi:hypothetical protein L873DRAFT_1825395 [Choiromyces venosus 120613-1]|uniref:Metallo-beta-lactamase domain-containing protein n=1 Tax=Choiromyces venosus 120613-1 TaxID=1336337 RepID=A0A3N4K3U2_9PEZI|nr:hypothetical protein L873DRAFT_1825395 [Choiromyces venosus 120613-1]
MSKASPDSTMVIRTLTPNITTLSVPFLRFNRIKFGGRTTIVKLRTGNLAVFSPVALTTPVHSTLQSLGNAVTYLVAPDIEHHMHLSAWKSSFPTATVIGPEGLYEKRKAQGDDDVPIDIIFTKENKHSLKLPEELAAEFNVEYFDGHANKEIVFLHKSEEEGGTLIQADLLFNLPAYEQFSKSGVSATGGMMTKMMTRFMNTKGRGQMWFNWYMLSKDKPSFSKSAKVVASWEFERIVPCHGDVIENGGSAVFKRFFAWHLKK